jgi:predicted DNA-binding transcriptional regulator AlpA
MRTRLFVLLTFGLVMAIADDRWLTIEELSGRFGIPTRTLYDWRQRGYGPQAVRLGRGERGTIRYRLSTVLEWEDAQEQAETDSPVAS